MGTDNDIIRRSRDNPALFGEIFDRHATAIFRYAARRAGPSAADDVMAETFLVAFEHRNAFDLARENALPWLFGIATNLLHRHHRAEAKMLKTLAASIDHEPVSDEYLRLAEQMDARAAVHGISAALRQMSTGDRDTLLLYAWAELSYEDIAQATDVPIGTVRSRLNRVRRVLRAATGIRDTADAGAHTPQTKDNNGRDHAAARTAQ